MLSAVSLLLLSFGIARDAIRLAAKALRAGLMALSASHVVACSRHSNNAPAGSELAGYPGGTDDPASRERGCKFIEEVRAMGVEIVDTIRTHRNDGLARQRQEHFHIPC